MTTRPTLPLTLPDEDATYSVLSQHFSKLRDISACISYDDAIIMCRTCGREGENSVKGSTDFDKSYGRPRFCSQPCADLNARWVSLMPKPSTEKKA